MSKFNITVENKTFESNEDGMLNLNSIWKECGLGESKRPSEWKGKVKDALFESENCRSQKVENKVGKGGSQYNTMATEEGSVAYAMWVSTDFYLTVIKAFVALRQGAVEEAQRLAALTKTAEEAHYMNRQERVLGMSWDESCAYAGIINSQACRHMLIEHPLFTLFEKNDRGSYYVTTNGADSGYFYNRGNVFNENTVMKVSKEGRLWLKNNNVWFNKQTAIYKVAV